MTRLSSVLNRVRSNIQPKLPARKQGWDWFLKGTISTVILYSIVTFISYQMLSFAKGSNPSILEVLTLLKMSSLIILVLVGFYELATAVNVKKYIVISNIVIIASILVALLILFLKLLAHELLDAENVYLPLFRWAESNGDLASIMPLVGYGALNALTSIYERYFGGDARASTHSSIYFAVADLPCLLPLLGIFLLASNLGGSDVISNHDSALLVGGAMAMFIYVSALLTVVAGVVIARDEPVTRIEG